MKIVMLSIAARTNSIKRFSRGGVDRQDLGADMATTTTWGHVAVRFAGLGRVRKSI